MNKNRVFNITLIALMAAVICVCSWITIPVGAIPFTLQTFGVFLALRFLGGKKGITAIIIYLLLGAAGIPVFSNFGAGIGKIMGPTGGYMLGFIFSGIVITVLEKFEKHAKYLRVVTDLIAMISYYTLGTAWFYFFIGKGNGMSIFAVLTTCVIPFIIPDIIKIALAELVSLKMPKSLRSKV